MTSPFETSGGSFRENCTIAGAHWGDENMLKAEKVSPRVAHWGCRGSGGKSTRIDDVRRGGTRKHACSNARGRLRTRSGRAWLCVIARCPGRQPACPQRRLHATTVYPLHARLLCASRSKRAATIAFARGWTKSGQTFEGARASRPPCAPAGRRVTRAPSARCRLLSLLPTAVCCKRSANSSLS